ncbi:MAG: hypothetical protein IJ496_01705 [Ruminococcus sp.]|nr:hypothetical protein [Ruminococcus sp.]
MKQTEKISIILIMLIALTMLAGCKKSASEPTSGTSSETSMTTSVLEDAKTEPITDVTAPQETSLEGYSAYDLMFVDKNRFFAGVNQDYTEVGQWSESAEDGVRSPMFPGYTISYGKNLNGDPQQIGVTSGIITDSTRIGMTYQELTEALGRPDSCGFSIINWECMAIFLIDDIRIAVYFSDIAPYSYDYQKPYMKDGNMSKEDAENAAFDLLEANNPVAGYAVLIRQ